MFCAEGQVAAGEVVLEDADLPEVDHRPVRVPFGVDLFANHWVPQEGPAPDVLLVLCQLLPPQRDGSAVLDALPGVGGDVEDALVAGEEVVLFGVALEALLAGEGIDALDEEEVAEFAELDLGEKGGT